MEREKGIHLSWIAFSLVATHEYITFIVHHRRKKEKWKYVTTLTKVLLYTVKCCHSDALIFNLRPRKKKCTKVLVWTVCEDVFVPLSVKIWRREKGLVKDRILTMIVIIITKIGINRTGKHNLHLSMQSILNLSPFLLTLVHSVTSISTWCMQNLSQKKLASIKFNQ